MDFDPIARAMAYPFRIPHHSYILRDGAAEPLAGGPLDVPADRHPVLAIGSNCSPDRLVEKFDDTGRHPIPVTRARLREFDVVYSAHITGYGSLPATLQAAPGTTVEVSVTWLTEAQEAVMHATESRGVNYDYCRLDGIDLAVDGIGRLRTAHAYVGRRGALARDGAPLALAAIAAEGRRWPAVDQAAALGHARDLLDDGRPIEAFIRSAVADPALRRRHADRLGETAAPFAHPGARVIPS